MKRVLSLSAAGLATEMMAYEHTRCGLISPPMISCTLSLSEHQYNAHRNNVIYRSLTAIGT